MGEWLRVVTVRLSPTGNKHSKCSAALNESQITDDEEHGQRRKSRGFHDAAPCRKAAWEHMKHGSVRGCLFGQVLVGSSLRSGV